MIDTLRVLSIGSPKVNEAIRNALLSRTKYRLFSAPNVWDLSAFLTAGKMDVAILHNAFPPADLRSCAVHIRHHFPAAGILLIDARSEILDDPLYGERIDPSSSPEVLIAAIEQLVSAAGQGSVAPEASAQNG